MYKKPTTKLIGKRQNVQNGEKRTYPSKIIESHYANKFKYNFMNMAEGIRTIGCYDKGWMGGDGIR